MAFRLSRVLLIYSTPAILVLIPIYLIFNRGAIRNAILNSSELSLLTERPINEFGNEDPKSNIDVASSNFSYSLSLDSNITKRGNWQRKQISDYCQTHYSVDLVPDRFYSYAFLLYDDKKKIVFCYVPKVGYSKWKYTFLLLNDIISFNEIPTRTVLYKANKLSGLSKLERKKRLTDYYKYVFIRNPMERLVSGYIDKIAKPLNISLSTSKREERYKVNILTKLRHDEYNAWLKNGTSTEIYPTFSEYVQFLNLTNLKKTNEHFRPIIHLCHPCVINYNFYGNFKLLPNDANAVLEHFKLNSSYYDNKSFISHSSYKTSDLVTKYFSELTTSQKKTLFHSFADELDFYYSLYPEEKDSHLNL